MKKTEQKDAPAAPLKPEKPRSTKKHGDASQGDSSRTQKGDPAQKAKGKQEGRK